VNELLLKYLIMKKPETFDKSRKVARRDAGKQRSNQNGSSDLEARKRLLLPGL